MASSASATETRTPRRRSSRTNRCRLISIFLPLALQRPPPRQAPGERATALTGRNGAAPRTHRRGRGGCPVVIVVVPPRPVLGVTFGPGFGIVIVAVIMLLIVSVRVAVRVAVLR